MTDVTPPIAPHKLLSGYRQHTPTRTPPSPGDRVVHCPPDAPPRYVTAAPPRPGSTPVASHVRVTATTGAIRVVPAHEVLAPVGAGPGESLSATWMRLAHGSGGGTVGMLRTMADVSGGTVDVMDAVAAVSHTSDLIRDRLWPSQGVFAGDVDGWRSVLWARRAQYAASLTLGWRDLPVVTVVGTPRPKGSLSPVGRGRMVDRPVSREWRSRCATRVADVWSHAGLTCDAVGVFAVSCRFVMPQTGGVRVAGAPCVHPRYGDSDKLSRNVLDAMTGVVYADDRQVASLSASRVWARAGEEGSTVVSCRVGVPLRV